MPALGQHPTSLSRHLAIFILPSFNAMATQALLDPLRAANYLSGARLYSWDFVSLSGGPVSASSGFQIGPTLSLSEAKSDYDWVFVSSSWTPEAHQDPTGLAWLRRKARSGAAMGGIDTGAFLLAYAGLIRTERVTLHYEHLAAFREIFPDTAVSDDLFVLEGKLMTTCGGMAAADLSFELIRRDRGVELANAAARYIFHERIRPAAEGQLPTQKEPIGYAAPTKLRQLIAFMHLNLETPLRVNELARRAGLSQRQLERLFRLHTGSTPVQYYQEVRLDRARGMITQTDMSVLEIAVACGFSSQEYFARVYRKRFGLSPTRDRSEGRVPFQFRAFPSHSPPR